VGYFLHSPWRRPPPNVGYIKSVLISYDYMYKRQLDKSDVSMESAEVFHVQTQCYLRPLPAIAPVSEQEHRAT
jgi:hypothetical protein